MYSSARGLLTTNQIRKFFEDLGVPKVSKKFISLLFTKVNTFAVDKNFTAYWEPNYLLENIKETWQKIGMNGKAKYWYEHRESPLSEQYLKTEVILPLVSSLRRNPREK